MVDRSEDEDNEDINAELLLNSLTKGTVNWDKNGGKTLHPEEQVRRDEVLSLKFHGAILLTVFPR